ncbi:MAG: hypothetical protein CYG60_11525 [Actinobacteria bacterium]|nr:MAG: hypothetical protein CYG60_11525 [Actinomycetota bacterium]
MTPQMTRQFLIAGAASALAIVMGYLVSSLGAEYTLVLVAIIVGALTTAIVFLSPRAGFYMLLISSVLARYEIPVGGVALRIDQLVLIPVVSGLALHVLPVALGRKATGVSTPRSYIPTLIFAGFASYIGANILSSSLFAPQPAESFKIVIWLLLSFMAFAAVYFVVGRYVTVREAFFAILAAGFVSAAAGIIFYLMFQIAGIRIGVQLDPNPKAVGTFFEANMFGSFQAFCALLGLSVLSSGRVRGWAFGMVLCGTLLSIVALVLSFTRAAWLGFLLGIIVLALLQLRGGRSLALFALSGILGSSVLLTLISTGLLASLVERFTSIGDLSSSTTAFRIDLFRIALAEWPSSPVFGLGTNSFGQRHFDPGQDFAPAYLPSLFLVTLYDIGVIGLLTLLITFALVVGAIVSVLWNGGWTGTIALALLGGMASMLVSYQATNTFWFSYNWLIIAFAVKLYRMQSLRGTTLFFRRESSYRRRGSPVYRMARLPER